MSLSTHAWQDPVSWMRAWWYLKENGFEEAASDLFLNADREQPAVQYLLGLFYEKGIGTEADAEEAAAWYRKAAEQGYPQAQYRLGLYEESCEHADAALVWFGKAAEQEDGAAQYRMCIIQDRKSEDESGGVEWCKKAVINGNISARGRMMYYARSTGANYILGKYY